MPRQTASPKTPTTSVLPGPDTVLSRRALNRALLARQMLLERQTRPVADMLEHLVGMQAQVPQNPYTALWSRLEPFDPEDLSAMIRDRQAVRIVVMRGTLHLVTARDCMTLRRLVQPVLDRALYTGSRYGRVLDGLDTTELLALGRALLEEQPRTLGQLRTLLGERWPDRDANSLAYSVHYLLPLVQVPPRGLWGKSGQPTCTTAEAWLGQPLAHDASLDDLVLRYLAAFGPATVQDVQTWSGLTGLRPVLERLQPDLLTFRDERGRTLFDLPDAPRPDPDTPAPPRFLPEYDNLLLSHDDRARIVDEDLRRRFVAENGILSTVLVDGFVQATWKIVRARGTATLTVQPLRPLTKQNAVAIAEEGDRLLAFLAVGATHDVQVLPVADPL
jgi:hypothetical protein